MVTFIEGLALTKPRPSMATLHRLTAAVAHQRGNRAPSYATVRDNVQALDPALVALALEGPSSYRDRHELVLRRRGPTARTGSGRQITLNSTSLSAGQWKTRTTLANDGD
ncbi:hypothetical protein ABIB45_003841 [Arthrobacter sp. UYCo732]